MRTYSTVQGDMWDSIALKLYGNERHFVRLMYANPDYVDVLVFTAGVLLRVPDAPAPQAAHLPIWKQEE